MSTALVLHHNPQEWAQEALQELRETYHTLRLDDRLTVLRTLREMAEEVDHER